MSESLVSILLQNIVYLHMTNTTVIEPHVTADNEKTKSEQHHRLHLNSRTACRKFELEKGKMVTQVWPTSLTFFSLVEMKKSDCVLLPENWQEGGLLPERHPTSVNNRCYIQQKQTSKTEPE